MPERSGGGPCVQVQAIGDRQNKHMAMSNVTRLLLAALLTVALLAAGTADAHYSIRGKSHPCKSVILTPMTDHAAFDIRAKGVGCRLARSVARSAEGWVCKHRVRQRGDRTNGIAHTDFRCRHPQHQRSRVIVFAVS